MMKDVSKIERIADFLLRGESDGEWVSKSEYPRPPREWGHDFHETALGWGKGKKNTSVEPSKIVESEIRSYGPELVKIAQKEYDEWNQDGDGMDEFLGSGGICDSIADGFGGFLTGKGFDVESGGQEGDDHAFLYATKNGQSFLIDIPPDVYETGGGYNWKKRQNVVFDPSHVIVQKID